MKEYYFDEENYMNHFKQAFNTGLFKEDEPYMYMGEDKEKVYFKHGLTRQYKHLIKEGEQTNGRN